MRRSIPATLAFLALLTLAGSVEARSYAAEMYTSDLRILEDGTLAVTEVIRFRFEDGAFTRVWRTLPLRRLDGIEGIESPDPIDVRTYRERISVNWRFPAIRDTVRSFTLSYRVRGAFENVAGQPVLRWTAFPREHAYRIERARAVLSWPEGWPTPARLQVRGSDLRPMQSASGALFEIGPLRSEQTVVIEAALSPGSLALAAPAWQLRRQDWNRQRPTMLAIAGIILVLGVALILRLRSSAIAPAPLSRTVVLQPGPPSDLPAILAGPICDGRVWLRHVIAGLIDLGARGVLQFEMEPRKSRMASRRVRIRRLAVPAGLGSIEQAALECAFRKSGPDGTVELRKAWGSLMRDMKSFERAVREELERRGEYDPMVAEGGKRVSQLGFLFLALAAAAGLWVGLSFDRFGPSAVVPVVFLAVLGTIAAGIGSSLPLQSASGRAHAIAWRGFARFMKDTARGSAPVDADRFQRWMPFAMALGIGDVWLRAGKKWKIAPPLWLRGLEGDTSGMAAWIAVFGAGGTGPAGAGGGAGAAGGGGSGAG